MFINFTLRTSYELSELHREAHVIIKIKIYSETFYP